MADYLVGTYGGWVLKQTSVYGWGQGVIWSNGPFWTGAPAPQGSRYICIQNDATVSSATGIPCTAGVGFAVTFQAAPRNANGISLGNNPISVSINGLQVFYQSIFVVGWNNYSTSSLLCPPTGLFMLQFQGYTTTDHTTCIDAVSVATGVVCFTVSCDITIHRARFFRYLHYNNNYYYLFVQVVA